MKILLIGNCQVASLQAVLRVMVPDVEVAGYSTPQLRTGGTCPLDADLVFAQPAMLEALKAAGGPVPEPDAVFPRIVFPAFHPDMCYLRNRRTGGNEPGSRLAWYAWERGLSIDAAVELFREDVFARLGYFDAWSSAEAALFAECAKVGYEVAGAFAAWRRRDAFMHTINHPKLFVMSGVARWLLAKAGIAPTTLTPEDLTPDPLTNALTWPVYPEIARRLGFESVYAFKAARADGAMIVGLDEFVMNSFRRFAQEPGGTFEGTGPTLEALDALDLFGAPEALPVKAATARSGGHPYAGLPSYRSWRKAMAALPAAEVDPVVRGGFVISPTARVATAGSCFAQHIARTLSVNGFHHFVSECAPEGVEGRNFGVFSARYGNVYTTRQLVQLFDRAFGRFVPEEGFWVRTDERFADPFRPEIEPDGFASEEEALADRNRHLAAVRRMFEELDVFVFTLGLTEAWRSRADGAVFPLAPGVAAGDFDPERYAFVNFTSAEVADDLRGFLDRLAGVNPAARVILTVSPVPLMATFEDRHVLTSTCSSKAALRVAVEEICRERPDVAYFPSYEIVTGNHARGRYFEDDLRSVRPEGVAHVMRLFFAHYSDRTGTDDIAVDPLFDVVCEEDLLDI